MELEKYLIPSYEFFGLFKSKKKNLQKNVDTKNNKPLLNTREKWIELLNLLKMNIQPFLKMKKRRWFLRINHI